MVRFARLLSILALAMVPGVARAADLWRAHMTGAEQLPPVNTRAQGEVVFELRRDGSLHYRMTVANLQDVTMAHIHYAPAGHSGGIVAWLYPPSPPDRTIPGRTSGVLAEGTLTAASLGGALTGKSIADLIPLLDSGQIYAAVHTVAYPAGEIRGQVVRSGR